MKNTIRIYETITMITIYLLNYILLYVMKSRDMSEWSILATLNWMNQGRCNECISMQNIYITLEIMIYLGKRGSFFGYNVDIDSFKSEFSKQDILELYGQFLVTINHEIFIFFASFFSISTFSSFIYKTTYRYIRTTYCYGIQMKNSWRLRH